MDARDAGSSAGAWAGDDALARLVAEGTLSQEQARAVRSALAPQAAATPEGTSAADPSLAAPSVAEPPGASGSTGLPDLLPEVGGYVGAVFVLAAGVVLGADSWRSLSLLARTSLLAVPAVVLLAASVAVLASARGGWPVRDRAGTGPRRRMAAVMTTVAAVLAGLTVTVGESIADRWQAAAFGGVVVAVAGAGYLACRCRILHVMLLTALAGTVLATVTTAAAREDGSGISGPWLSGLGLLAVAALWLALTLTGWVAERALGLAGAGVVTFVAGQTIAAQSGWPGRDTGYGVLAALAAACLAGYVRSREAGVLVVGVLTLAVVVPQSVLDWTDGALGAAGALLVVGLSIVGAALVGLRLRHRRPQPPDGTSPRVRPAQ